MIKYRRFIPHKYKCLYCGHSPLEICAFVWNEVGTGKEKSYPVLVCPGKSGEGGCGTFFDPTEFGLNEYHKDLIQVEVG